MEVIGANPLGPPFKVLLDGIGAVLAFMYKYIPNYGAVIILLTLAIRVLLLPLGIKQVRSMQAMQAIQPKVKEIQRKFKGKRDAVSRQKMNEETMRLYKEHGVNPFSGCLPLLAQFPVLIALFGVLNVPNGLPHVRGAPPQAPPSEYTRLYKDLTQPGQAPGIDFLGANLVCSAAEAGTEVTVPAKGTIPKVEKDCGKGAVRIPFYVFLVAMIGTTYYQQRQMQRASPGQSQQQQMLTRIMPIFFGFIGFRFPAGLVIYWTTTNLVQIAQQHYMLPRPSPDAVAERGSGSERRNRPSDGRPPGQRRSRPEAGRGGTQQKGGSTKGSRPAGGQQRPAGDGPAAEGPEGSGRTGDGRAEGQPEQSGGSGGSGSTRGGGSGGRGGGDRKKRRKR
jgi:YidC/Oxa1 family membrane protein insertase